MSESKRKTAYVRRQANSLKPFALISKSRDGKNTKTITSDVAVFDLNEPLGFNPQSEGGTAQDQARPSRAERLHPRRQGNAERSDRRHEHRPAHDSDYDEATQQITTAFACGHRRLRDGDDRRRHADPAPQERSEPARRRSSGFQGAERLELLKNVHVVMRDVGKSGFMPGNPSSPADRDQARGQG